MPILISVNDLSLWRETRHFDRLGSYKTWINENKRSKALFMVVAFLVLHLAFPLEHSKINIS